MRNWKLFLALVVFQAYATQIFTQAVVFREYIGANFENVRFSDVPINPHVEVHFILSFAIDYTTGSSPKPTNGKFNVFWDADNLGPSQVLSIKRQYKNVKVALSIGGDTVGSKPVNFTAFSVDSWVSNAVTSLTRVIKQYNLDGIDIDYEHFKVAPDIFSQCIGRVVATLKKNRVISFASIAPYDDVDVQSHYMANYNGGKVLVSFSTDSSGGLKPDNGFFTACEKLRSQRKLNGIFVWSADNSKASGFSYERQSQALLVKAE